MSIETCKIDDHEKSKGVQRKERVKGGGDRNENHIHCRKNAVYIKL